MSTSQPEEHQIPHTGTEPTTGRASRESSLFEVGQYEDEMRQQWDRRIFNIKLDFLNAASWLGLWSFRAVGVLLLLVLLYMICLFVIHYTMPDIAWLEDNELTRLEGMYGQATIVGAPVALMANAWIIWWMSQRNR